MLDAEGTVTTPGGSWNFILQDIIVCAVFLLKPLNK